MSTEYFGKEGQPEGSVEFLGDETSDNSLGRLNFQEVRGVLALALNFGFSSLARVYR